MAVRPKKLSGLQREGEFVSRDEMNLFILSLLNCSKKQKSTSILTKKNMIYLPSYKNQSLHYTDNVSEKHTKNQSSHNQILGCL